MSQVKGRYHYKRPSAVDFERNFSPAVANAAGI